MHTVIDPFDAGGVETFDMSSGEEAAPATITTTLYDLLAALQEVVDPGEDALVVAIVVSMLRAGRLTWHRGAAALESAQSGHRPDTGAGRYWPRYASVDDLLWETVHTHHTPSEEALI
jgi:hypothetical protein